MPTALTRRSRFLPAGQFFGAALLAALLVAPSSCSGDDDTTAPAKCTSTGGPVEGDNAGLCVTAKGEPITQTVGKCVSEWPDATCTTQTSGGGGGAGNGGAGGSGSTEEEAAIRYTASAPDDDCKYDVSFTNSCIELNKPVTFTLTLKKRADDGAPATGAHPDSPEIFLESEPSHISPSLDITAPESPPGTYKIGPIVFDRSGRWVVRFHFFESCSDIPEDSPHGHAAFYIDVP